MIGFLFVYALVVTSVYALVVWIGDQLLPLDLPPKPAPPPSS